MATDKGKTIAIVSYITIIGWVIAFILNQEEKSDLASYHIRQTLLLMIAGLIGMFIGWIPLIGWAYMIALLVLWIIGLIAAVNGEKKPIPIIGELAQDWFSGL